MDIHAPVDLLPPGKHSRLFNVRGSKEAGTIQARGGISIVNPTPFPVDAGIGIHSVRRLNDNIGDSNDWVGTYIRVIGSGQRVGYIDATGAAVIMIPSNSVSSLAWSGRPLSLTPWRPSNSPRTFMYVWDADRQAKIGRNEADTALPVDWIMQDTGIVPPNDPPANTAGAGSYQYRYRYRAQTTGVVSNPSPETLTMYALGGTLTATLSTDPQVTHIDFFRFGGALLEYFYVGSAPNTAPTFVDTVPDATAQLNEILTFDHDQPFTVAGLPLQGTVTVATAGGLATVTYATGDQFETAKNGFLHLKAGTIVNISGRNYILYRASTATQLIVRDPLGTAVAGAYEIQNPVFQGKSLPFVWGPFQNVFFACGDVLNPGTLYWTNGNDPDTASSFNFQEVTPPSEPTLNGFVMDGRAYLFTAERLWAIFPNPTSDIATWEIIETPCQRSMWTNWCYCVLGEKQGGGECYFLSHDGIWVTQGGRAECITDADLYELFPHDDQSFRGTASNGLEPVDMVQRTYLRLAHRDGYIYFDYLDILGAQRTLVYEIASKAWYADTYTPGLRVHYADEGRESGEFVAGADNGVLYLSGGTSDNGTAIPCQVRTRSEDFDDPGVQKLFADITHEMITGDQSVSIQPLYNNETILDAITVYGPSPIRTHRILDINSGAGTLAHNACLDITWSNIGASAVLFLWMPSASPKPADIQQRCIEWHEFLPGIPDAYVTGVRLWVDTRDLNGIAQTKFIGVWSDQNFTGQTLSVLGNGETPLVFSWPVFKGKLGRLLPTDTNRCRILNWEWLAENEPPILTHWDTNWHPLGERTSIAYVTGCIIVADTFAAPKTIVFQSEFENTLSTHLAIGASNVFASGVGRATKSFAFTPFRAEQLRFYSHDGVPGRLYTWEWATHFVEPRYLANWDSTYTWFETERLIKGIRIDADTIGQTKFVNVELDGVVYTTLTVAHNGRLVKHYDLALDPLTNEYPRASVARLYPIDANAAFLYGHKWFHEEQPAKLANWNATWDDGGTISAKWLQGFILDADTQDVDKTVVVEYYPEGNSSALTVANTFVVNHTGRSGKAYALKPPVVAHKFRLRPTDTNQRWLYGVKWVFEPHPEKVHHWETQGYAQGLPGFQHRRRGYVAYEATAPIYWVQEIDGVEYAIQFPSTNGEYRKLHAPCLPIKGKLWKDTLRCDLPSGTPLVYIVELGTVPIEDFTTEDVVVGTADDTSGFLNADDPSIDII